MLCANYAVQLSKQRNCYQSSLTFLKHGLNMSFFTTCKGFQLSINQITVISLSDLLLLHSLSDKIRMDNTLSEVVSRGRGCRAQILLIRSWAGVVKSSNGAFPYFNRLGMDLGFSIWPSVLASLQCERPSRPDN